MSNLNLDPRINLVKERIKNIKNIIPIVSSKGGVGKSLFSSALSWGLKDRASTALLDLDFWGASDHILIEAFKYVDYFPEEDKGILPVDVEGLKFMSVVYYTQNKPLPLRGSEFSDAFIELMSATRWGKLDYLIIDMPPGLNDPLLDVIKFFKEGNFIIIATPSRLTINVVEKTIEFIKEQKYRIAGLVENMAGNNNENLKQIAKDMNVEYLGSIPYLKGLELEIENPDRLKNGEFFKMVKNISNRILKHL